MSDRIALGMIKVNSDIIVRNAPIDKKFWDIYLKCCANEKSIKGVEIVRVIRRSTFGYHLFFDPVDMTSSVVSFKIRIMKMSQEESKQEEHETVQQLA